MFDKYIWQFSEQLVTFIIELTSCEFFYNIHIATQLN